MHITYFLNNQSFSIQRKPEWKSVEKYEFYAHLMGLKLGQKWCYAHKLKKKQFPSNISTSKHLATDFIPFLLDSSAHALSSVKKTS